MYIYPNIRDIRENAKLTQIAVAEMLGTTQKQYSRWERGESEFSCHIVVELAKIFRTTTDELLRNGYPIDKT